MTDIDFKTIVGHDEDVIARALAWAVATIELLPDDLRPLNEIDDRRAILKIRVADNIAESWLTSMRLKILEAQTRSR